MKSAQRCDAILWDLDGRLLSQIRSELKHSVRQQGPAIETELGDWENGRVLVARPRRAIAKSVAKLSQVLGTLGVTYQPSMVGVVGPATGPASAVRVGQVFVDMGFLELSVKPPLALGKIATGVIDVSASTNETAVTTDWAERERNALNDCGLAFGLLAVVIEANAASQISPPRSNRSTIARSAGRFFGKLSSGSLPSDESLKVAQTSAAKAVSQLLSAKLTN